MKIFVTLIFISYLSHANATNYYFSTSTGDDSRTPAQAKNSATPWKTLAKLNSFFSRLDGGDSILLKRGEIFYGNINISKSGLPQLPIVISAYGEGKLPSINGFAALTKWNLNKNGVYESIETLDDSVLNMVTLNNAEYPMGRYPNSNAANKGWLIIDSHSSNNSITDNTLAMVPEWTGGEAVIRKNHYVTDRNIITSQKGNTLFLKSGTQYAASDGFGYFIQNHIGTLDQFGEWYYDPKTKKLNVYFGDRLPSAYKVRAANINTLVTVRKQQYIVFENLSFEGADVRGFDLYYSQNISIKNCDISYSGMDAIDGFNSGNLLVENCKISNSNNNALDLIGTCNDSQIKNNVIKNSGIYAGMAGNTSHSYSGININGDNNLIAYNEVDSSGYIGIRFAGNSVTVKNNYVNFFCFIKDDGGGIYTGNTTPEIARYAQIIERNIILNGIGAKEGTSTITLQASGIYLDDNSANVQVIGNTVAYSNKAGILLHNSHDIFLWNNTSYDNATQLIVLKDAASEGLVRNNTIRNNIFFSANPTQLNASFLTNANDINLFGNIDSNYYSRPLDDNVIISTSYVDKTLGKINIYYDLEGWKSRYEKDITSKKSLLKLEGYKLHSLQSPNKFNNGNFNDNSNGVQAFKCKVEWQHSGQLPGGYVQVKSSPDVSSPYITIHIGAVQSGKNYILRFRIKGSDKNHKTIGVFLRKNISPYTNLAQTLYRNIDNQPQEYEIVFSVTKDESDALLVFSLTEPTTYWLNNIQLYEANADITKPEELILFEYNPGRFNKKIILKGNYSDTKNKSYSNSIILPPYSSIILIKQN